MPCGSAARDTKSESDAERALIATEGLSKRRIRGHERPRGSSGALQSRKSGETSETWWRKDGELGNLKTSPGAGQVGDKQESSYESARGKKKASPMTKEKVWKIEFGREKAAGTPSPAKRP